MAKKKSFAPEERKLLLGKANISLLRSFSVLWDPWFYKHFVPPGLKSGRPKNKQTDSLNLVNHYVLLLSSRP